MYTQLKFKPPRPGPLDDYAIEFRKKQERRAINAATSKNVASIAARGLKLPESLTPQEVRIVCASVLAQTPPDTE